MNTDEVLTNNTASATDFLGQRWEFDCMGCALADGSLKVPGGSIYQGRYCILIPDPEIPIPGFFILQPLRHVNSFCELTSSERQEVGTVLAAAEHALKSLHIVTELTLVQEERSRHLHIWIFPMQPWMVEKFGHSISALREIAAFAKAHNSSEVTSKVLAAASQVRDFLSDYLA